MPRIKILQSVDLSEKVVGFSEKVVGFSEKMVIHFNAIRNKKAPSVDGAST